MWSFWFGLNCQIQIQFMRIDRWLKDSFSVVWLNLSTQWSMRDLTYAVNKMCLLKTKGIQQTWVAYFSSVEAWMFFQKLADHTGTSMDWIQTVSCDTNNQKCFAKEAKLHSFPVTHSSYQQNRHCWADSGLQRPPVFWASIQAFLQDVTLAKEFRLVKENPPERKVNRCILSILLVLFHITQREPLKFFDHKNLTRKQLSNYSWTILGQKPTWHQEPTR